MTENETPVPNRRGKALSVIVLLLVAVVLAVMLWRWKCGTCGPCPFLPCDKSTPEAESVEPEALEAAPAPVEVEPVAVAAEAPAVETTEPAARIGPDGPVANVGRPQVSLSREASGNAYAINLKNVYADLHHADGGMVVRMAGATARQVPGAPDIASLVWVLPGKPGMSLMPTIQNAEFAVATQEVDVVAVPTRTTTAESPESEETVLERTPSEEFYSLNEFWPERLLRVQEAWLGSNKLVRVTVSPIQYNPTTRTIRLCYELEAHLEYVPSTVPEGERGPL